MIHQLRYDNTNTYLISCDDGYLMFDTGWARTFLRMCQALGELGVKLSEVRYLLISHFHPDHMGIAGELMEQGIRVLVMESQVSHIHDADSVFAKDQRFAFTPLVEEKVQVLTFDESRDFLQSIGIDGVILATPGHSDDSISLLLDSGDVFVGDLYPLYELEVHEEPAVQESWESILNNKTKRVFYGHAKTAILGDDEGVTRKKDVEKDTERILDNKQLGNSGLTDQELYKTVKKIMDYIDKGMQVNKISVKLKLDKVFVEDVCRMYLTHRDVGAQGILDRIEIKGK